MKKINEEFLHFLWKNQFLTGVTFYTNGNLSIKVVDPGQHNHDSGPDFFNAKIEIDGTLWAGNVELHINSSDWIKHGHSVDSAYDSVILHVVYFNDTEVTRPEGGVIPTVILRFPIILWDTYKTLQKNNNWLACQSYLPRVEAIHYAQWTSSLMVEKLEKKTAVLSKNFADLKGHWDAILCRIVFRSFGLPVNTSPFEMLALLVPYTLLLRNKSDPFILESILFGQAGMLNSKVPSDKYTEGLKYEFARFKNKVYQLKVPNHMWKFMRMRPASFPSLRIAQLAAFCHELLPLHEKIITMPKLNDIYHMLRIKAGDYWNTHFQFGKESVRSEKFLGKDFMDTLIINSLVPYIFFFGQMNKSQTLCDYALQLLEEIRPEKNTILKKWGKFGMICSNAFESQALLYLYKNYCIQKRCLECQFGNNMIIDGS